MSDRIYYRLEKDGKTETAVKGFITEHRDAVKAWEAFTEKHGGTQYYANDSLLGIMLKMPDRDLWVTSQKMPSRCYKPRRKKGNLIFTEFKELPHTPDGMDLARRIGVDTPFTDRKIHLPSIKGIGDTVYITLYKDVTPPVDAVSIKLSEFYKAKEDAEQGLAS